MKFFQPLVATLAAVCTVAALPASSDGNHLEARVGSAGKGRDYGVVPDLDAATNGKAYKDLDKTERQTVDHLIGQTVEELKKYGASHTYPKKSDWQYKTAAPKKGDSGFIVDEKTKLITTYYGDDAPYHGATVEYLHAAYPSYVGAAFTRRDYSTQPLKRSKTLSTSASGTGMDRNEEPMISMAYAAGGHVVAPVPNEESKWQSQIAAQARRIEDAWKKANPGQPSPYKHVFVDNRDTTKNLKAFPWRGPKGVKGYPDPLWPTDRVDDKDVEAAITTALQLTIKKDKSGQHTARVTRSQTAANNPGTKKRDLASGQTLNLAARQIGLLQGQETNAPDTSVTDDQQFLQMYSDYFGALQTNASALLQPVLVQMLNNTDSLLTESMAWSIYSMISPGVALFGPFMGDMDCFDYLEDMSAPYFTDNSTAAAANGTAPYGNSTSTGAGNGTSSFNQSMSAIMEFNDDILTYYYGVYQNATNAVNATGTLGDMENVIEAFQPYGNATSLLPESETTIDSHTLSPMIPFLQGMYEYNGFDANNSATMDNSTVFTRRAIQLVSA